MAIFKIVLCLNYVGQLNSHPSSFSARIPWYKFARPIFKNQWQRFNCASRFSSSAVVWKPFGPIRKLDLCCFKTAWRKPIDQLLRKIDRAQNAGAISGLVSQTLHHAEELLYKKWLMSPFHPGNMTNNWNHRPQFIPLFPHLWVVECHDNEQLTSFFG